MAEAERFVPLPRDFYRDNRFAKFYAAQQAMYRMAETRFASTLGAVDFNWFPRFYGAQRKLSYRLILGMNNGSGNYGPRLVYPDGRMELFSIIGCWAHEDAGNPTFPPVVVIFHRSFTNSTTRL